MAVQLLTATVLLTAADMTMAVMTAGNNEMKRCNKEEGQR